MFLYLQIISALVRLSFGLPMKGAKTQRYNTVMTGYTPRTANHIISSPVLLRREPGGRLRSQCQPGQTTQCRQATRFTSSACVTRARDRCVRNGTGAAPRRTHSGTRAAGSEPRRTRERRRKRALRIQAQFRNWLRSRATLADTEEELTMCRYDGRLPPYQRYVPGLH